MRIAYAIVESRETAGERSCRDLPFPGCPSAAPDLETRDEESDRRRAAVDCLKQALDDLSALDLDQDVLGDALSQLSTTPFARHPSVRDHEEARARESGGSFFTPSPIVERLLDATLEPLLDELVQGKNAAEREAALLKLSIVDPSCGSGRFLIAAAHRVAGRLARARRERENVLADEALARFDVIERCLYGIDVDPLAIEALRFRLRREARKAGRTLGVIAERTICADSLSEIDWTAFQIGRRTGDARFDVVIGNPPWTSYSGRHRGHANAETIANLASRFPEIARWPALHSAMLALSARIVRDGGHIGLVLPLRVADLDAYGNLRASVTERLRLICPVTDEGESAFSSVVQPTGLFTFCADGVHSFGKPDAWPIERRKMTSRPGMGGSDDLRIEELLAEIDRLPKFPPRTFGDPGVHTGNIAAKLMFEGVDDGDAPIREGRDVVAFDCLAARRSVRVPITLLPGEYFRMSPLDRYLDTPILLRQTADRPVATRHVDRTYFRNSLLACSGVADVSDLVVVAFLNSALYALFHRRSSGDSTQRSFPQVKVRALQNLPLPPIRKGASSFAIASPARYIEQAASLAEIAATQGATPDAELLERLERLILRTFGASEDLAPLLLERAGPASSPRRRQFK